MLRSLAFGSMVVLTACVYEDHCVNGAVRVDGKCVLSEDDGGVADAGNDAGFDAGRGDSGTVSDGGACDAGRLCDGVCVDPSSNQAHCGSCGTECVWWCLDGRCADPVQVSAGAFSTCARLGTGHVACWGDNRTGQLGNGETEPSAAPVLVAGIEDATDVAVGAFHACATTAAGLRCWGGNDSGQLGDGTTVQRVEAVTTDGLPTSLRDVSAGLSNTCAVDDTGTVFCWGDNTEGQLGTGSTDPSNAPVAVSGIEDAVEVEVLSRHACAIRSGGKLSCWGNNNEGQIGDGMAGDRLTPFELDSLSVVVGVTLGDEHTCVRLASGTVQCWGGSADRALGLDTTTPAPTPTDVPAISGASALVGGVAYNCARQAGALVCWGDNDFGQLGLGTFSDDELPSAASLPDGAIDQVEGGVQHACLLREDGQIMCWGRNDFGQLGDRGTENQPAPVLVVPP